MDFFLFRKRLMRIISGSHKGRRIEPPKNMTARPTTDFAKESLFNVLNNIMDFEDAMVLDLFSGTGSISYEFASRGAASVVSVEQSKLHANFIRKMKTDLKFDSMNIVQGDVFKYINTCSSKFDLIFADPPYALPTLPTLPDLVMGRGMLREGGLFVLEHSSAYDFSDSPFFKDHRRYGSVNFTFFGA